MAAWFMMGVLWLADSSAVGTFIHGNTKKAKTIAKIEAVQGDYMWQRDAFKRYLDGLQVQNQTDFYQILDDELHGRLEGRPAGPGPNYTRQKEIMNTTFAEANTSLDKQQKVLIGDVVLPEDTISWDDVGEYGSSIGSRWHGLMSVFPKTSLDLLHFVNSTGNTIQLDIDRIVDYVNEYNTQIEGVQKSLSTMGSSVKLETFDKDVIDEQIATLKFNGENILAELGEIETYTDIVNMSRFVLNNMEDGGRDAVGFGVFLITTLLLLLILHGAVPVMDIRRIKENLKKQIDFIRDEVSKNKDPWLEEMVNKVFPIIEKTELGQELLVQEGDYTAKQLFDYLNTYHKY